MVKSFEKFVETWKKLADTGATEINEATFTCFLLKNFGTSKNNFTHYKQLSINLGFITVNKERTYSVNSEAIRLAFDSKDVEKWLIYQI